MSDIRRLDIDNFFSKSGKEKRELIKNLIFGDHTGRTKDEVDHDKVLSMAHNAFEHKELNPYFSMMLDAMKSSGCTVNMDYHITVKKCGEDSVGLLGSFNHSQNQVEICQETFIESKFPSMRNAMQTALSHIMIQAYDHCRANVDPTKPEHDMCSSIRAAALSGICSSDVQLLNKAQVAADKRGYQTCVLRNAVENFLSRNPTWDLDQTKDLIKKVFPTCFDDYSPHDRLPYDNEQAELSYKAFISRNRYNV